MPFQRRTLKSIVFAFCLVPAAILAWDLWRVVQGTSPDALGANPIQKLTFTTGDTTLTMLCITLAITPLRRLTALAWLIKFRRMVVPGDQLRIVVVPLRKGGTIWKMRGEASVDGQLACEAEFLASMVAPPKSNKNADG